MFAKDHLDDLYFLTWDPGPPRGPGAPGDPFFPFLPRSPCINTQNILRLLYTWSSMSVSAPQSIFSQIFAAWFYSIEESWMAIWKMIHDDAPLCRVPLGPLEDPYGPENLGCLRYQGYPGCPEHLEAPVHLVHPEGERREVKSWKDKHSVKGHLLCVMSLLSTSITLE